LRAQILAALGAAGCSQVPQAVQPAFDGVLYDRIDKDGDGSFAGTDCNDSDSSIRPDATELCNDIDDNCDGVIDEGVRGTYHRDADGDSFGSPTDLISSCARPDGYVENDADCNDLAAEANPDGEEVCDGLDNDCDGNTDDIPGYWPDEDGDGYGTPGDPMSECDPMPDGYAPNQSDCDDGDPTIYPDAPEICLDGLDNDCDGLLSCVKVDIENEETSAACSVTWKMQDSEVTDWSTPCAGCDFEFDTELVVSFVTGEAVLCDAADDAIRSFIVEDSRLAGATGSFSDDAWDGYGTWDGTILTWYAEPFRLPLESGGYASFAYMGELAAYEVEEYYYSYYYYEGRPLSVDGEHLVAEVAHRTDWRSGEVRIAAGALSPAERERAAQAWTRAGLAEHASVASFNRFVMELMSLGAPPHLLMESLRAAGDEVIHARDCFSVASALSGQDVGPGGLPTNGVLDDPSLEGILTRLLAEGCVEETVSTSLAALRLAYAEDPAIRSTLERIVSDETRHAALAWRSARWILSTHPELVPLARRVLAEAVEQEGPSDGPDVSPALRAHGVLSRAERCRERARTLREVVTPAIEALLAEPEGARSAVAV
jgi:hypothetical protein